VTFNRRTYLHNKIKKLKKKIAESELELKMAQRELEGDKG
jgi:hypothetical protein